MDTSAFTSLSIALIIVYIIIFIVGLILYFLPSIIASKKNHTYKNIILLINFFLGATVIGWIACLIWAFIDNKKA